VLQVTGKKRVADVDDMCFDGELVKAKKSKGIGGVATEMVDAEVNNGMQRDNNAKNGAVGTAPWQTMKIVTWNCRGWAIAPQFGGF
jgi:hypothetical protein